MPDRSCFELVEPYGLSWLGLSCWALGTSPPTDWPPAIWTDCACRLDLNPDPYGPSTMDDEAYREV